MSADRSPPLRPWPDSPLVMAYGLGVNSKFARRGIRDLILFADTGGEKPETYQYHDVIQPWLKGVGFPPSSPSATSPSALCTARWRSSACTPARCRPWPTAADRPPLPQGTAARRHPEGPGRRRGARPGPGLDHVKRFNNSVDSELSVTSTGGILA